MRPVALVLLLGACSLDTSALGPGVDAGAARDGAPGVDGAVGVDGATGTDGGGPRDGGPAPDAWELDAGPPDAGCVDGATCEDATLVTCAAGVITRTVCTDTGAYCESGVGAGAACVPQVCEPDAVRCSADGGSVLQCNRVGSGELAYPCTFGCDAPTGDCNAAPTCPLSDVTDLAAGDTNFNLCSYENNHGNRRAPGCPYGGADGWDRVFRMVLTSRRTITLEFRDNDTRRYIDTNVYIRTSCDVASSQVACADDIPSVTRARITTTLDAGTYYVFADSWDSFGGQCGNVRLSYTP